MGLIDWFKRLLSGADGAAPAIDEAAADLGGLNFKTAIEAHIKWKARLEDYIQGRSQEDLQVEVVRRDDQCLLGKWIHGSGGERYGAVEAFAEMQEAHADFHRYAGMVLAAAQAGDKINALAMLQHGAYVRASERVKMLLARLYVRLDEGRRAAPPGLT